MTNRTQNVRALLTTVLFLLSIGSAFAHGGPTYPIAMDQPAGPYKISVWADPDVGNAYFYVIVTNRAGGAVGDDVKVDVGVQVIQGQSPEVSYAAPRRISNGQPQYFAVVDQNVEGWWRVRAKVQGAAGSGEVVTRVKARAVGVGIWEIALYIFPFAALGILFLKGYLSRMRPLPQPSGPAPNAG